MATVKCPSCRKGFELYPVEIIPASVAVYCGNCETITRRSLNGRCAACGSDSVVNLEQLLAGSLHECVLSGEMR